MLHSGRWNGRVVSWVNWKEFGDSGIILGELLGTKSEERNVEEEPSVGLGEFLETSG